MLPREGSAAAGRGPRPEPADGLPADREAVGLNVVHGSVEEDNAATLAEHVERAARGGSFRGCGYAVPPN